MNTVTVRNKGQITLPVDIREEMGIGEDEILTVTAWKGKAVLLIPQKLQSVELLEKTSKMLQKRGITLEELLAEWSEVRHNS